MNEEKQNIADKVINVMKEAVDKKVDLFKPEIDNLTEEERESAIDRLVQITQTLSVNTVIDVYNSIKKHRNQAEATAYINAFMLSLTTRLEVEREVQAGIGEYIKPVNKFVTLMEGWYIHDAQECYRSGALIRGNKDHITVASICNDRQRRQCEKLQECLLCCSPDPNIPVREFKQCSPKTLQFRQDIEEVPDD